MHATVLIFIGIFFLLWFINSILNLKSPFFGALKSTIFYPVLLIILSSVSEFIGIPFSVNLVTTSVSILAGIPGIISMAVLNLFF